MTENKRFIGSSGGVYDQYKGDRFAWSEWKEIIQIMNNLNEKAIERSKALSKLQKENEQLRVLMKDLKHEYDSLHDTCAKLDKKVKCVQEEANDYCEELMGKDEFIRLYRRQRDRVIEENNQLKMENNSLKLLVQNWEALDEEKDEQLDKQNQALKKFHDKNEHIKKIIRNYNTNEYKHSSDALTDIIDILEK